MKTKVLVACLCVGAALCCVTIEASEKKYKPIFIIHGILSGNESMVEMAKKIELEHPGTEIQVTGRFGGWSSLEPMWHQVLEIGKDLMQFAASHPEGIHLIGYSQGGLIARAILQQFPNHNVKTFISLSSPQAGQYGTEFLHLIFPTLVRKTAYELFYSAVGQHTSVGNYWNDPHEQQLFYNYSRFLPYVNNELLSSRSEVYKHGLIKLERLILIGGPDDGVITPWQSSHFGYYNEKEEVIDMRQRETYKEDLCGLKTLDLNGKLTLVELSGVSHLHWHTNATVLEKFILPFLD
ncbi:Lysosomal thioesterase PPT2 homolog [Gryllus bimaculatus]|nr:Lysosomal thioesterase PPT2 homolog [Gryllus bimaculatus]